MSAEFKPRKRRIDYKASKLFPHGTAIMIRRQGKVKPREPIDPLELEIAELELELKKALGRIKSGRVPELIPRDEKLVVGLKRKISVLTDKLNQKRSDVDGEGKT